MMSEINVTPFVDVMLVLLIIFMVTAPLMKSGIEMDLPEEQGSALTIKEETLVQIRDDNRLYYNGDRVTAGDLEKSLKSLATGNPKAEVFLEADRGIPYGDVMKVMALIKRAGVDRLGMVTKLPAKGR
ncbi:MAG: ExbD/TolR family protein [Nitrospinae bacterium]|nr:ExbD/TolR family protein [Nitrospinota bacterium]